MSESNEFATGDYIDDRYRVFRRLQGGMGTVYVAQDLATDQIVAIKTVNSNNVALSRAFLSEAQTWILLERHKFIAQAKASFILNNQPYLVVEYIDGGDLRGVINQGPVDLATTLRLTVEFCTGAGYAYQKLGLIHRDIKPDNLLLTRHGQLKIADFGLARAGKTVQEKGVVAGTPKYMPPEQWLDGEAVTKQSDIYAFGIVMYEMLTGVPPFVARDFGEMRDAHMEKIPTPPQEINNDIPAEMSDAVLKCLEKNPIKRFLHYEDLADRAKAISEKHLGISLADGAGEERDSTSPPAGDLLNSGDSLFALGQFEDALRYYDRLISAEPGQAKFWRRKAETLAKLDRFFEAELFFNKALSLEPSNIDAVIGNTKCQIKLEKYDEALRCCNPALEINPNNKELLRLKQLLLPQLADDGSVDPNAETVQWSSTINASMDSTGAELLRQPEHKDSSAGPVAAGPLTVSFYNTIIRDLREIEGKSERELPDATIDLDHFNKT